LLGEDLSDQRVVEIFLVCLPEMFEVKTSSLEENKNFSETIVVELDNAFQASEKITSLRIEENVESAFLASYKGKNQSFKLFRKKKFPPCPHCKNDTHLDKFCWYKPRVKCRVCNQLGHVDKVSEN